MNNHYYALVSFADNLIRNYGDFVNLEYRLSLDKVDLQDQSEFARLYIEYEDRDVSECFLDPLQDMTNDDVTCALLALLKRNDQESQESLSNILIKRSINAHKYDLQSLIDERCDHILREEMEENGYSLVEEGYETEWRRRA